jgi:Ca2+-binding EF-hand superfamily protein
MQQLDSGGASVDELTAAFSQFDREKKGALLGSELRYILKTMGEVLTDTELDDLFRQAGFSDDKPVDYSEFAAMAMKGVSVGGGGGTGKKGISKGRERRSMRFHK